MAETVILSNNLQPSLFNDVDRYRGISSQFRVQVEVTNFLGCDISIIDSESRLHVLHSKKPHGFKPSVVVRLEIEYNFQEVVIDALADYSEEFCFKVLDKFKNYCHHRVTRNIGHIRGKANYSCLMVFSAAKFLALGHRVEIPETGITIVNGNGVREKDRRFEAMKQPLQPGNDVRSSGITVNIVDPDYKLHRAFFTLGKKIYEADIDRVGKSPGMFCGFWNQLNPEGVPVEQNMDFVSLEDALSGNNSLGITIYPSIVEAEKSLEPEPSTKRTKTTETKEEEKEDPWIGKEKKAKVSQAWIKAAGDFIKSVLPALITGAKWLVGFLAKTPIPV